MNIDKFKDFAPTDNTGIHHQIACYLKDKIENGTLKNGEKLPSLRDLAGLWHTNIFSLKLATDTLVELGLLNKPHGKGMFVAPAAHGIFRVGLYSSKTLGAPADLIFFSTLRDLVAAELQRRNIEYVIWDDYRNESAHAAPPEDLQRAVAANQVQAVIGIIVRSYDYDWFRRLPVKKVQMMKNPMPDFEKLAAGLRQRDCRRIALIAPETPKDAVHFLLDGLQNAGVRILPRNRYLIKESAIAGQSWGDIGYQCCKELLSQKNRPDALIVYPDNAVQGAIQAILERNIRVPDELYVLFHRNLELSYFCAFDADYIDVSINAIARQLLDNLLPPNEEIQ